MIWELEKYKKNTALLNESGVELTYEELKTESEKIAAAVAKRCVVFCLCSNTIGSAAGYIAFINGGIVPVLLDEHLEKELLDRLLSEYSPSYLWLPQKAAGLFGDFISVYCAFGYCLLKTDYDREYPLYDDLALLLTTSGSTGSPKLVRQSYENIRANTQSIVQYLKIDESERPVTTLPMNYTYGLSIINTHLYAGAAILLTEKGLMQKAFWRFFQEQEATSFGGVPYTYEMLDKLQFFQMNLPSLRTMTQAGGKLTPQLHEKFARYAEDTGRKFVVMYGQCEATARMGYLPDEMAVKKKGSMGIAIPGGRFKLTGADGVEIKKPYITGELVYEGANVTLGYAECGADLKKGDERHGILATGDMAQFDEDGYFYIVGRKKRFLKIYGNRVNLDEMDRLIKGKYEMDAACAGADDAMYIFLTDGSLADEVKAFAAQKTKLNPAAFKTVVLDDIPKNASGKVLYKELERYYSEDIEKKR